MASLAQERGGTHNLLRRLTVAWPEAAIILLAFAIQIPFILNADLGWLLTVCDKMLAGAKLGVDVLELNPPLSVLMYMPAAYLSTLLPIPAHIFVIIMVLVGAIGSTKLTLAALRAGQWEEASQKRARIILLVVFTLIPGLTFGQREHVAVLTMAPFVALAASHAAQQTWRAPNGLRWLAGICAGFAMCIKPHFALMAALPLLWAAFRCRSLRPLLGLECWVAAFVVVAYFGTVFLTFPEYFSVVPRWAGVAYLPLRMPPSYFYGPPVLVTLASLAFMLRLTCGGDPAKWAAAAPWLLAALGGFVSYVLQGKGFPYMRLPAVSFALLAPLLSRTFLSGALARSSFVAIVILCFIPTQWLLALPDNSAQLQKIIGTIAPPHPKILMVGSSGSVGHPLVRKVDGVWASAAGAQLLAAGADFRLEYDTLNADDRAVAERIIAVDRSRLREDLQLNQPDVLLIDSMRFGRRYNWEAWARVDPAIDYELNRNYRLAAHDKDIAVWLRR